MASQELVFGTETWTVAAPDDITISQVSGVLKIDIKYDKNSLFNSQAHGIDTITFTPLVNNVDSVNGFKSSVEFNITNALSVPIGGFDLMLFNNTPPPLGMLDTANPSGHPSNYAHFHNTTAASGTGAPFAPETVTAFLPNFMQNPDGLAPILSQDDTPPSELRAAGILAPGATVSARVATMHSVEVAGADNGFGINFFPIASPSTSPPTITGLPATEDGSSGLINPFSTVAVTDTNPLPIETTTITVKDATGALSDSVGTMTAPGMTHPSVGTYSLPAALPGDLTTTLHSVSFGLTADANLTLSIDNDGDGQGQPPALASTSITVQPGSSPPIANPPATANFSITDLTTGVANTSAGEHYTGPVAGITDQIILATPDNINITANIPNVFVHTGAGTDAIAVSSGINVLDGGTGSNFLTGSSGTNTFFVDDRSATADIWSTVNSFHAGDAATVWGVTPQDFNLAWVDGQGAAGFTGLTLHATASGKPTASLTLAGFTQADIASGRLSVLFGSDPASGSAYMYVHGNS